MRSLGDADGNLFQTAWCGNVINACDQWLVAQAESQRLVDKLADERQSLADDYRNALRESESLKLYIQQLNIQSRLCRYPRDLPGIPLYSAVPFGSRLAPTIDFASMPPSALPLTRVFCACAK